MSKHIILSIIAVAHAVTCMLFALAGQLAFVAAYAALTAVWTVLSAMERSKVFPA